VPDAEVLPEAMKLAKELANGPTRSYGALKTLLNGTFEQTLESQMELEARAIADLARTNDGKEGIQAFLAKRKPVFTGT